MIVGSIVFMHTYNIANVRMMNTAVHYIYIKYAQHSKFNH